MAEGAWTPAFDSLWESQKTRRLARSVKSFVASVDMVDVAGAKFLRLMSWMRDNASSGDLGPVDRASIALAVGIAGPKDKHEVQVARGEAFYRSLVDAEFITADARGHVKGWDEGPGQLVRKRERDRLRKEHDRVGHPFPRDNCPRCEALSGGNAPQMSTNKKEGRPVSAGNSAPRRGSSDRTEQVLQVEQTTPTPTAGAGQGTGGDLSERQVRELLEAATPERWRDALQALLIAGMTSTVLLTFFRGTTLEERNGFAIVRAPNAFAREWLETKYRREIAKALDVRPSRVVFAVAGQDVQLEPDVIDPDAVSA